MPRRRRNLLQMLQQGVGPQGGGTLAPGQSPSPGQRPAPAPSGGNLSNLGSSDQADPGPAAPLGGVLGNLGASDSPGGGLTGGGLGGLSRSGRNRGPGGLDIPGLGGRRPDDGGGGEEGGGGVGFTMGRDDPPDLDTPDDGGDSGGGFDLVTGEDTARELEGERRRESPAQGLQGALLAALSPGQPSEPPEPPSEPPGGEITPEAAPEDLAVPRSPEPPPEPVQPAPQPPPQPAQRAQPQEAVSSQTPRLEPSGFPLVGPAAISERTETPEATVPQVSSATSPASTSGAFGGLFTGEPGITLGGLSPAQAGPGLTGGGLGVPEGAAGGGDPAQVLRLMARLLNQG